MRLRLAATAGTAHRLAMGQRRQCHRRSSVIAGIRIGGALSAFLGALAPAAASAQNVPLLGLILPELVGQTITLEASTLQDQNHAAHFRPGVDQVRVPTQVNGALLTLRSTYPLGTPAGGFTCIFDPALGTLTRSSDSFGPSFAECAVTIGRGRVKGRHSSRRASWAAARINSAREVEWP